MYFADYDAGVFCVRHTHKTVSNISVYGIGAGRDFPLHQRHTVARTIISFRLKREKK
jgi:hypothetical protein